jgi:DNA-directed RNA polymerase specialized sigma24 family protein
MSDSWKLKVSKREFTRINRALTGYFRRTVPHASADDLAADTWVRITRWYRGRCSLWKFAFIVAPKVAVDARRKREVMTTPIVNGKEPAATGPGPHSVLLRFIDHAAIERALEQVDDIFIDVLRLWLAGRDNVQIAAELGMKYNTVRSQLRRGQQAALTALRVEVDADQT